jgi:hypothetical protein
MRGLDICITTPKPTGCNFELYKDREINQMFASVQKNSCGWIFSRIPVGEVEQEVIMIMADFNTLCQGLKLIFNSL